MCLLVFAWRHHPRYRLVIAANRDEYHARPSSALAPWNDATGIVAGRDLTAGGAWFAIDARRRVGIVTNFREFGRPRRRAPSRGALIPAFLAGSAAPGDYLANLEGDAPGFAGFNLLVADDDSLWYASNRADVFARELPPGIYGLSNEFLDTPWPKLLRVRTSFEAALAGPDAGDPAALTARLLDMLDDRETVPPGSLPPSDLPAEWALKLSAPFVLDPEYGTRCSTVLVQSHDHSLDFIERRFDAQGAVAGETEYALNATDA